MKKHLIIFSMLFAWITVPALAQNRLLKYADKQMALENYSHAASIYNQAFQRKQKYATAKKAAEAYTIVQDYQASFDWWEKAMSYPESERADYFQYMQAALKLGRIKEVQEVLSESGFSKADFPELDFELIAQLESSKPKVALFPVEGVNSDGSDQGLKLGEEGIKFFSSDRGEAQSAVKRNIRLDAKSNLPSKEKSDFNDRPFFKIYQQDTVGTTEIVGSDLVGAKHLADYAPMSSRGLVFFTVLREVDKIKKKKAYTIKPEIYFGKKGESGQITGSKPMPFNNLTEYGVQNPFVDEQANRIYFASDMPGGYGGFDIYFVDYDEELIFGSPVNVGPIVNTKGDESYPFLIGNTLFFSSKGHPGVGGMDIFSSSIVGGGFSPVRNLGIPFNSTRDDFAYYVASDGKRYLSSDREGGMGLDDIYFVRDLNKILLAKVLDCDETIISEELEVYLNPLNVEERIETRSNSKGEILAELELNTDFLIQLSKPGYFAITDSSLSTKALETDTLRKEYRLARIPYGQQVWADIIYYDLDKSYLREQANATMARISELMLKYDFLSLKVASHTDSRASDAYNKGLSERRTMAVLDFLVSKGIPADRVQISSFGEERLMNDCGDGKPCPERLHQRNRRSELVLEAFSDRDIQYHLPLDFALEDPCDLAAIGENISKDLFDIPVIYFDFDRSEIRSIYETDLDRVSYFMKSGENLQLFLAGHTDQRGNEAYNMKLAERRAKAVADYLIESGIDPGRIRYEWFGKSRPINDCSLGDCTEEMHQENRRTELILKRN